MFLTGFLRKGAYEVNYECLKMCLAGDFVVVQLLSHVQLCDPMDCSMSGSSILCYFLEFAQIYVHWVGDVI